MLGLRSLISLIILQVFFINSVVSDDIISMVNPADNFLKGLKIERTSTAELSIPPSATGLARVEKLTQDPIENDQLNILTFRDHMPADEKSDRVLIDLRGQDRK
ncbi:hypothetical protein PCASD_11237 [Puccinia coronata f. sp. avenae]|uniref:Uncharacterized protein n=1 Tax=Puccinia coronata f. sp. avenae TaxID=200324 RepID=A0A2N5UBM6_9BASI|nr:hypothetical protein PCASD_23060 [Puccinia coronata f. sp. avenae]PLW35145.1 hypothetical protein PCASD_11237 [Puccinia coronata f. sp. avenae]